MMEPEDFRGPVQLLTSVENEILKREYFQSLGCLDEVFLVMGDKIPAPNVTGTHR